MFTAFDKEMMERALALAGRGLYTTDPNPRVGCVIVRDQQILGQGWTSPAGGPHAEVNALRDATTDVAGSTAYVTLEPCSHHGRTPPCADALIKARVKRIVVALEDPNPLVNGGGAERLRAAGIEVEMGLLENEARELNPGFFKRMTVGLPWVTLKMAASLDGRVALANGASRWITGAEAREDVQRLRARSSAILTGIGTILDDDPQLTVRSPNIEMLGRHPLRVVCDTTLRIPPHARVFKEPGEVLVFTGPASRTRYDSLRAAGATIFELPLEEATGELSLRVALQELATRHCNEVLIEAGPTLAGRCIERQLVDELVVYIAPTLLGDQAKPMFILPSITDMSERSAWHIVERTLYGDDLRLRLHSQVK